MNSKKLLLCGILATSFVSVPAFGESFRSCSEEINSAASDEFLELREFEFEFNESSYSGLNAGVSLANKYFVDSSNSSLIDYKSKLSLVSSESLEMLTSNLDDLSYNYNAVSAVLSDLVDECGDLAQSDDDKKLLNNNVRSFNKFNHHLT